MAFGTLSPDQARYRDLVAERTGLNRDVVTAWIAAESGWGTDKAQHNYLNIGPGRRYASVEEAAAAVADTLAHERYADVRAARGASGCAQVAALASSPWDLGRYGGDGRRLRTVFEQLTNTDCDGAEAPSSGDDQGGGLGAVWIPGLGWIPDVGGVVSGAVGNAQTTVVSAAGRVGLWLLLVATGLVLLGYGAVKFLGVDDQLLAGAKLATAVA